MDAILPLFFDKRTVLVSMDTRRQPETKARSPKVPRSFGSPARPAS